MAHRISPLSGRALRFVLPLLMLAFAGRAAAQGRNAAVQTIRFEVKPVSGLAVSGSPEPLVVDRSRQGEGTVSVRDASTRYSLVANRPGMRVAASIDGGMPEGTKLLLNLESRLGTSTGVVDLSNGGAFEVVSGIRPGVERDRAITYVFVADAGVSRLPADVRHVTLTLTE